MPICSPKCELLQRCSKAITVQLIFLLKPDMNILDVELQIVDYFFAQLVKSPFLLISIFHLGDQQVKGIFDVLLEQLLFRDFVEMRYLLFELYDNKYIFDGH